jgi:Flp pilus assembly protein TadG
VYKHIKNNNKGQAIVELAITLPILIMILCAIIDFGWIFMNQNIVDHSAREGARYAIVHSSSTIAIQNYTEAVIPDNMVDEGTTIIVSFSTPSNPREGDVTVTVNREITALTPVVGVFTQGEIINLESACTMKVE